MEDAGKPVRVMDMDTIPRTNGNRKAFALLVRQRKATVKASLRGAVIDGRNVPAAVFRS
jgi:hypothetical protein